MRRCRTPIIVGIRDDGEIQTITPWQGDDTRTGRERLASELAGAVRRAGNVYAKTSADLEKTLAEAPIFAGPDPRERQPWSSTAGFARQGLRRKVITRESVVKQRGGVFYQDARGSIQFPVAGIGNGDTVIRLGGGAVSEIKTLTEVMRKNARDWLELVCSPVDGDRVFQRTLIEAEQKGATDMDGLITLISLAYAAAWVGDRSVGGMFSSWYREMGQRLLCSVVVVISVIEANKERQYAELN